MSLQFIGDTLHIRETENGATVLLERSRLNIGGPSIVGNLATIHLHVTQQLVINLSLTDRPITHDSSARVEHETPSTFVEHW